MNARLAELQKQGREVLNAANLLAASAQDDFSDLKVAHTNYDNEEVARIEEKLNQKLIEIKRLRETITELVRNGKQI